jgi:hypothetical protein
LDNATDDDEYYSRVHLPLTTYNPSVDPIETTKIDIEAGLRHTSQSPIYILNKGRPSLFQPYPCLIKPTDRTQKQLNEMFFFNSQPSPSRQPGGQTRFPYQPIDIIITPATPHLNQTPGAFASSSSSSSCSGSPSYTINNRANSASPAYRSSSSSGWSGKTSANSCARVLQYDIPTPPASSIGATGAGSYARVGRGGKFFGYEDVDGPEEDDGEEIELGTRMDSPFLYTATTSTSTSTLTSNRTKLNLLLTLLALFLASLGVVSVMIPDLVTGLTDHRQHYDQGGVRIHEQIQGLHPVEHSEGLHGMDLRSGNLKVRDDDFSLRSLRRRSGVEAGRWGFSMGFVGQPHADVDTHPENSVNADADSQEVKLGLELDLSAGVATTPGQDRPFRAGPEVKVVQVEQVQKMLLQQSRERLRRRKQVLQGKK